VGTVEAVVRVRSGVRKVHRIKILPTTTSMTADESQKVASTRYAFALYVCRTVVVTRACNSRVLFSISSSISRQCSRFDSFARACRAAASASAQRPGAA
jgi:hypothetical protein